MRRTILRECRAGFSIKVFGIGQKDHLVFIDCRGPVFATVPLPADAHFWIFNTHTKHALVDGTLRGAAS